MEESYYVDSLLSSFHNMQGEQMKDIENLRLGLNLPPVSQIGIVVSDIDKAVEYYTTFFGLGPFTKMDFRPDKYWYRGEPAHMKIRQAKAMWGEIELELMQPIEGESLIHDFLAEQGEGINHLGFFIDNYDEAYEEMICNGFMPMMEAEAEVEDRGIVKAVWFDTIRVGGVFFELIWRSWLRKGE